MARSDKPAKTAAKTAEKPAKADTQKGKSQKDAKMQKASSAKPAKAAGKPNLYQRFVRYIKDVRAEMKRVVWPNRQEVVNSSIVVVVTLLAAIAFVLVVDQISSTVLLDWIPRIFGS